MGGGLLSGAPGQGERDTRRGGEGQDSHINLIFP